MHVATLDGLLTGFGETEAQALDDARQWGGADAAWPASPRLCAACLSGDMNPEAVTVTSGLAHLDDELAPPVHVEDLHRYLVGLLAEHHPAVRISRAGDAIFESRPDVWIGLHASEGPAEAKQFLLDNCPAFALAEQQARERQARIDQWNHDRPVREAQERLATARREILAAERAVADLGAADTPIRDGRQFGDVLRDWLARNSLTLDSASVRLDTARRAIANWLAGGACRQERAMRALMTLVDEGRA